MFGRNLEIEKKAQYLLDSLQITRIPIPVEEIAKKIGVSVVAFDLGEDVSGVLHIKNNSAKIGYNPNESKVRQRFTVAHELGHYQLHRKDDKIFVDNENYYQLIMFRSAKLNLSAKDITLEQEANAFAAALLMPKSLIQDELKNYNGFDLSDNSMITDLSKKFEVSIQAISYRIINLAESNLI